MYSTPDGKTFENYAEYTDALVRYEWEAGREVRHKALADQAAKRKAAGMTRDPEAWRNLPGRIRSRYNLK